MLIKVKSLTDPWMYKERPAWLVTSSQLETRGERCAGLKKEHSKKYSNKRAPKKVLIEKSA